MKPRFLLGATALLIALLVALLVACTRAPEASPPSPPRGTLVLYDADDLGPLYASGAGIVAGHFGIWQKKPISDYRAGELRDYRAAIYVGSSPQATLPDAFRRDVAAGLARTIWVGENYAPSGFSVGDVEPGPFRVVRYKGVSLARSAGVGLHAITGATNVLAFALRDDGEAVPWAVRSGSVTYVAENPFAWVTTGDRFLAFADLLFDDLAPERRERHRALVRIEDVSPNTDPAAVHAIVEVLAARDVPFSIALIPVFVDPRVPEVRRLRDAPALVAALRDASARGGTLVMHGYTHQTVGVSGEDYEFHPEDPAGFADDRLDHALAEIAAVGLPTPRFFELPHYAGSAPDMRAVARRFPAVFQRETVFDDAARSLSLTLPFAVDDPSGVRVVPENLGYFRPETPDAILEAARAVWVVRDGIAGFFFHPMFDPNALARLVDGLRAQGWQITSAGAVAQRGR